MAESTRPAASFALEADGAVGSAATPQMGAPSANPASISIGLSTQAPGVDNSDTRTFKAIAELSSGILAPKIKEAAQEQFITGVQRAMTGEALGEIVKDQPWYTDIFAPSAAPAGARAYTSQKAIADWAGRMEQQMPELAKASPEALNSAAVGTMQGFMTGDAAADAAITAGVVEQMAPLFKRHAKEHYIYNQKQASIAQTGAWTSLAKVYQGAATAAASGSGTVSFEDHEAAKQRLIGSIQPFADQSDESFERNVAAFLESAATNGDAQVVKLFKETGLYEKIGPDRRATLDRHLAVAGRQTLDKQAMPALAVDVAMLINDMRQDPHGVVDKVKALNAKAAALTGVTEADLIPPSMLDNIVGNVINAQAREADARAKGESTAAAKAQADAAGRALAASQLAKGPGFLDRCLETQFCKEPDAEAVGYQAYLEARTAEQKATVLNNRVLKGFGTVKTLFMDSMRQEDYLKGGVDLTAKVYQGLEENVKPHYFSEAERQMMDRFTAQVRSGVPPEAAWLGARNAIGKSRIPDGEKNELSKLIRSHVESQNENVVGWNNVPDSTLDVINAMVWKTYQSDRVNVPPEIAVKRAYAQASANGLDLLGKYAMVKTKAADPALYMVVGEGQQATANAFNELMEDRAERVGSKMQAYEAYRLPDVGKRAVYRVTSYTDEGKAISWDITSDDVKARVKMNVGKQIMQRDDKSLPLFPTGAGDMTGGNPMP